MAEKIKLAFLWHMHQPFYVNPLTGEFEMPWVRLHGLKDYWGMVAMLEEFPHARMTFNLVPSLLSQIECFQKNPDSDPLFSLAFQSPETLTPDHKTVMQDNCFQAHPENQISRFPRLRELYNRVYGVPDSNAARRFQQLNQAELRDLQVLSQLCWFDEIYLAHDSVIHALVLKGRAYTEEDKRSLRAKELEVLSLIIPTYRKAAERGQIEISTSPYFHPILPLLCDTSIARISQPRLPLPTRNFHHPEDAVMHLSRAVEKQTALFGQPPRGLWPSEGSVSNEVLEVVSQLGFRWAATDEEILARSMGLSFARDTQGVVSSSEWLHSPVRFRGTNLHLFFRDRELSDAIGFVYSRMDPANAADNFIRRVKASVANSSLSIPCVCIALDGENAWDSYPQNGRPFLRELYRRLTKDPIIEMVSLAEALEELSSSARTLDSIWPGSWIASNFAIWIGDHEDNRAWDLLSEARDTYEHQLGLNPGSLSVQRLNQARESLMAAEGSDWCWWYGPEHATVNDLRFDALFRAHLINVYQQLDRHVPAVLAEPLKRHLTKQIQIPPTSTLRPEIDGVVTNYFEWMGAGSVGEIKTTMHQGRKWIDKVLYGWDDDYIYIRCDLPVTAEPNREQLGLKICLTSEKHLALESIGPTRCTIPILLCDEQRKESHPLSPEEASAAYQRILEIRFSKALLTPDDLGTLTFWIILEADGAPVERIPIRGGLAVNDHLLE